MLAFILVLLKILGILLLSLFLLFILSIVMVLFVPVRYRSNGYYEKDYSINAQIFWLLHILTVVIRMKSEEKMKLDLKLFGITIWSNHKVKKQKNKKKREQKSKGNVERELLEEDMKPITPHDARIKPKESDMELSHPDSETSEYCEESIPRDEKTKRERVRVHQILDKIKCYFNLFYDKISNIKRDISYYLDVLQSEAFRNSFTKCKKRLLIILHAVLPKKWHMNIRFGKADHPDMIGEIMGIWGMLYPLHRGKICLETSFEEDFFEAGYEMKGSLRIVVMAKTIFVLLFDKDIKNLRSLFKREVT